MPCCCFYQVELTFFCQLEGGINFFLLPQIFELSKVGVDKCGLFRLPMADVSLLLVVLVA